MVSSSIEHTEDDTIPVAKRQQDFYSESRRIIRGVFGKCLYGANKNTLYVRVY